MWTALLAIVCSFRFGESAFVENTFYYIYKVLHCIYVNSYRSHMIPVFFIICAYYSIIILGHSVILGLWLYHDSYAFAIELYHGFVDVIMVRYDHRMLWWLLPPQWMAMSWLSDHVSTRVYGYSHIGGGVLMIHAAYYAYRALYHDLRREKYVVALYNMLVCSQLFLVVRFQFAVFYALLYCLLDNCSRYLADNRPLSFSGGMIMFAVIYVVMPWCLLIAYSDTLFVAMPAFVLWFVTMRVGLSLLWVFTIYQTLYVNICRRLRN